MSTSLADVVDALQQQVGESLVAVDIWETESALGVAGFGTTSATGPLLHRLTQDLRHTASLAGTELDDYHIHTVAGGIVAVVSRPHLSVALLLTDDAQPAWVLTELVPAARAALDAASI
jgi:hypothetical protein